MSTSSSGSSTDVQGLGYLDTAQTLSALLGTGYTNLSSINSSNPVTLSGAESGINTAEIVAELMEANAQPQQQLQQQLSQASSVLTAYNTINNDVVSLQNVADELASPSGWQAWTPTSTTGDATATVGTGATGGSITFTVNSLAQAESQISSGSASSESAQITSGPLLVAAGGGALGIGTVASSNLSVGNHTIAVAQASSGASLTGTSAPSSSTTISSANDTLTYSIDGATPKTITVPAGTYTVAQLATAVSGASGGDLSATVNSSGDMVLTTNEQGSGASLQVTGGSAALALGFGQTPTSTANGTDGIVTIDGATNVLTDFTPGQTITLNGANGATVAATFTGPLSVGSMSAAEVNTGNGSLQSVVQAINAANVGVSASAVSTGSNQYRLSLQSTATGAANTLNIATDAFSGAGSLTTVTNAADASITVGDGPGAFDVTNDTNTLTGLMPGVSLDLLQADPGNPTTITLQPDGQTMANTVQTLVTAANQLITDLNTGTAYTQGSGATSGTAGPLLGDPTAESLLDSVLSALSGEAGVNSSGSAAALGITMGSDGTLTFDSATFAAAYDANPTQVANTFISGGSSSSPLMSFYESTDATASGNYDVDVTAAASQATDTGAAVSGGAVSTGETLTIGSGGATASYTTSAGETLTDIAAGLNQALAASSVPVNAEVVNGSLQLTSMAYGSSASFTVTSTASGSGTTGLGSATAQTFTGTDVEGTINGQAATGIGQLLQGATGTAAQGLLVLVNATSSQVGPSGVSGTVDYQPGLAQALAHVSYDAANPSTGTLVNAISGVQSNMSDLATQISNWDPILQDQETQLENEYDNMETSLASLKTTQSYLTQYMNSANTSSSSSGS